MAEPARTHRHNGGNGNDDDRGQRRARRFRGHAIQQARECLRDLTGQDAESVSAFHRTRHGWSMQLETVELERVPRTTDIMASYVIELDEHGDLMRYERVARYYRNQATPQD